MLCIQGKVEMTLELLRETEAKSRPAGKGREPPQALPDPLYVTEVLNYKHLSPFD